MTSLNISLPQTMRAWVDKRVARDGYGTTSEFVRALIRNAQKEEAAERLAEALIDGADRPPPGARITRERWRKLRVRTNEHIEKLLLEGLDSGPPIPVTPEFWRQMHARVDRGLASKKKPVKR